MAKTAGLFAVCSFVFLVVGCHEHSSQPKPADHPNLDVFGLHDDQERTLDQDHPGIDGRLRGVVSTTRVQVTDYEQYQRQEQAGRIDEETRHDQFIYYAIRESRDVGPAMIVVTERYKAPVPLSK